jgi:hypothetical protein
MLRALKRIRPAGIAAIGAVAVGTVALSIVAGQAISGISPTSAPRGFVEGLAQRNCTQMLDNVCGSFACPTIPPSIPITVKEQQFQEIDNDGKTAHVQVFVDIRVKGKMGEVKVEVDFPATVTRSGNKWCVKKESIEPAVKSFVESLGK